MKVSVNFISACYVLVWRCLWIAIIISVFVSYIHIIQKGTRYEWNTTARESNIVGSLSRLERKQYKLVENGKSISDLYSVYLTGRNICRKKLLQKLCLRNSVLRFATIRENKFHKFQESLWIYQNKFRFFSRTFFSTFEIFHITEKVKVINNIRRPTTRKTGSNLEEK